MKYLVTVKLTATLDAAEAVYADTDDHVAYFDDFAAATDDYNAAIEAADK